MASKGDAMNEPNLTLIETTIAADSVRMRFANDAGPTKATERIDFRIPLDGLVVPVDKKEKPALGDPERQFLAEIRAAALFRVQNATAAEIQRLRSVSRQVT